MAYTIAFEPNGGIMFVEKKSSTWWSQTLEQTLINGNISNDQPAIFWDNGNNTTLWADWFQTMSWNARPRIDIPNTGFVPIVSYYLRWNWVWVQTLSVSRSTPEYEQLDIGNWVNRWWVFHYERPREHRVEELDTNFELPHWVDYSSEDVELRPHIHFTPLTQEINHWVVAFRVFYQIANPYQDCRAEVVDTNNYAVYEEMLTLISCELDSSDYWTQQVTKYTKDWDYIWLLDFPRQPSTIIKCHIYRDIGKEDTYQWDISLDSFSLHLMLGALWTALERWH